MLKLGCLSRCTILFAGLSCLVVLPLPVMATSWDVRVSGVGARSCKDWVDWKNTQQGELRAMTIEWAQGFISGHNIYARQGGNAANSVVADVKILSTLLDSYCQKAPEQRILAGVVEIIKSLGGASLNLTPKSPSASPGKSGDAKEKI